MKNHPGDADFTGKLFHVILVLFLACTSAMAQQSRAEAAADELVSLSADRIIFLLTSETGLLLQVKRDMVRKAYDQGRLLDPQDLTDEALFRLVREDENIRVLITREIEDRYYVRVKPTREELGAGLIYEPSRAQMAKEGPSPQLQEQNQEERYWSKHEGTEERYPGIESSLSDEPGAAKPPDNPGQHGVPGDAPSPRESGNPPARDPRRLLEKADEQIPEGDYSEAVQPGTAEMPRTKPGELPRFLSIRNGTGLSARPRASTDQNTSAASFTGARAEASAFGADPPIEPRPVAPSYRQPEPPSFRSTYESRSLQPVLQHSPNPYADVPSLYDLYSHYSRSSAVPKRFGLEIFHNGTGNFEQLPMDLPVGPEYVIGSGDGLNIELWGSVAQRLVRDVDRQGRIALPEVGAVEVAGKSLAEVQHVIQAELRTQFHDVQADVSLSRLRSVRVYVVGDVEKPGAYDISSLSTPLNAIYLAGGPTSAGSMRIVRHLRGKQLLQEIDLYDLLLHGVRNDLQWLQPGDTILVPPLGPEVTVEGMVRRPAIYELDGESNLAEVLQLAGGVLQSGTLRHVDVERIESHLSRTMLRVDIPEDNNEATVRKTLEDFQIQNGDTIKISPILPYAEKTVFLEGHVFRPGKFAYREGMRISDIVSDKDLLPEPYERHAEIIRLSAQDYSPQVLAFNLADALHGEGENLALKPFDTVHIFGRYDFEDTPEITVTGAVRDPGDHLTNGVTRLRDAVYLAGGLKPDAELGDAQVFRQTEDGKLKVLSVNLEKALAGVASENILLRPKDRIFVHINLTRSDPPAVSIQGEVARPGKYPLGESMTVSDLVRLAGGLKRSAYTEKADLTRYSVEQGKQVVGEHLEVPIARALAEEPDTDLRLRAGDVLAVRQVAGWSDIGATITVKGEVAHPGTYGIKEGERLSAVLQRAGGFSPDGYPYGAILQRKEVRELEQKSQDEIILRVKDAEANLQNLPETDAKQKQAKSLALAQWQATLEQLSNTPPSGRVTIRISSTINRWRNTPADVQVRAGDILVIPKRPDFIMISGQVYNPTAVSYRPGQNAKWYLSQAGGPTMLANKKAIFVIRADGSVVGNRASGWSGDSLDSALRPGDTVVAPEKALGAGIGWQNLLLAGQVASSIASTAFIAAHY